MQETTHFSLLCVCRSVSRALWPKAHDLHLQNLPMSPGHSQIIDFSCSWKANQCLHLGPVCLWGVLSASRGAESVGRRDNTLGLCRAHMATSLPQLFSQGHTDPSLTPAMGCLVLLSLASCSLQTLVHHKAVICFHHVSGHSGLASCPK